MSTPAAPLLSPVQAALALHVARLVRGIGEMRLLLHLLAHPWDHTVDEIVEATGMHKAVCYRVISILEAEGLLIKTGHVSTRKVKKGLFAALYRARHAVNLKEVRS